LHRLRLAFQSERLVEQRLALIISGRLLDQMQASLNFRPQDFDPSFVRRHHSLTHRAFPPAKHLVNANGFAFMATIGCQHSVVKGGAVAYIGLAHPFCLRFHHWG